MSSIDSQLHVPDDIFALYSRFELDMSQYRVFRRDRETFPATPAPPAEKREVVIAAKAPIAHAEAPQPARVPDALATPNSSPMSESGLATDLTNLRQILAAFRQPKRDAERKTVARIVVVRGISGGVGTTTVTATLARQLAREGLRTGIYDERDNSLMPMFFGMRALGINHRSTTPFASLMGTAVQLLPQVPEHKPELLLERFGRELDCLLIDDPASEVVLPGLVPVLVTLADIGSTLKLLKSPLLEQKGNTICIINRFDERSEMQRELRHWYDSEFSRVVCIEHHSAFAEALAQGNTALDQYDSAPIAGAFEAIASAVLGRAVQTAEVQTLKTGKLALCL